MKRILFVTSRNVLTTCGELRLIKNRANTLYSNWRIVSDVIAISSKSRIQNRNEELEFAKEESIIGMSVSNPISVVRGFKKVQGDVDKFLSTGHYSVVILSGVGTMYLAKRIKRNFPHVKLFSDIHGANEDIIEFGKGKNLFKRIKQRIVFIIANDSENRNMKLMDGVFVVSKGLKHYLEKRCEISQLNCYIAPCAVSEKQVSFNTNEIDRRYYREKYNINDDTILFVYSGGVSPWQCIEETIKIFEKVSAKLDSECKMLILSHSKEIIQKMSNGNQDILIDSYSPDEVKKVLCAGDFAFMIRRDCITNNVAYPNKFLEYVESGMKIITTPYVYDVAEQTIQYKVGFLLDMQSRGKLIPYISNNFRKRDDFPMREKLLLETGFSNRLQPFVQDYFLRMDIYESKCGINKSK